MTQTMTEKVLSAECYNLLLFSVNKSLHKLPGAERTLSHPSRKPGKIFVIFVTHEL